MDNNAILFFLHESSPWSDLEARIRTSEVLAPCGGNHLVVGFFKHKRPYGEIRNNLLESEGVALVFFPKKPSGCEHPKFSKEI